MGGNVDRRMKESRITSVAVESPLRSTTVLAERKSIRMHAGGRKEREGSDERKEMDEGWEESAMAVRMATYSNRHVSVSTAPCRHHFRTRPGIFQRH